MGGGGMLGGISPSMAQGFGGPVLGIAQGVLNTTINNEAQKRNKEKLADLLQLEQQDRLGLDPTQQRLMDQQLNAPVARAAQDAQQRGERIAATAGDGASGADLARLRQEAGAIRAAGSQDAALEMQRANAERELAQQNEIEQRIGLKAAMKRDDWDSVFNAASQVSNAAGQTAGAPPSTQGIGGGTTSGATSSGGGELATPDSIPELGGEADSAGDAASAVAGDMSLARSKPTPDAPAAQFSEAELTQFQDVAARDPKLFGQMFLAAMSKKKAKGGTGG